jgi:L-ascorbate metabolism protein UlaG (beta-lactamase superfamily)
VTMIKPVLSGDALAAEIDHADPGNGLLIWWLGQSGFLVKGVSGRVLFDPYLSDSLTAKYEHTDKPHVRMTALAIPPGMLHSIDIVTSSHNHTDHLDADTLTAVLAANPTASLVIPEANRAFVAERISCDVGLPLGLTDGQSIAIGNIVIHAVPAAHEKIDRDGNGRCRYLGYVVQFGGLTVYHSGDTLRYLQMAELLRPFAIDVAFLPINGNRPERRVAGNMLGDEAAQLAHDIGARLAIPCHYEMFEFNTEPPDLFVETCRSLGQPHQVLRCGERLSIGPKAAN